MSFDVLDYDRKLHSSYTKWTKSCDLHEDQDVLQYKGKRVTFHPESFMFMIDEDQIVHDWTLSAKDTDTMFQYAYTTEKLRKQEERKKRYG